MPRGEKDAMLQGVSERKSRKVKANNTTMEMMEHEEARRRRAWWLNTNKQGRSKQGARIKRR